MGGARGRTEQAKKQHGRNHWYATGKKHEGRRGHSGQPAKHEKNAKQVSSGTGFLLLIAGIFIAQRNGIRHTLRGELVIANRKQVFHGFRAP